MHKHLLSTAAAVLCAAFSQASQQVFMQLTDPSGTVLGGSASSAGRTNLIAVKKFFTPATVGIPGARPKAPAKEAYDVLAPLSNLLPAVQKALVPGASFSTVVIMVDGVSKTGQAQNVLTLTLTDVVLSRVQVDKGSGKGGSELLEFVYRSLTASPSNTSRKGWESGR